METLVQDLRYTFRLLRKNAGFAILAVFTLALGIGANTAIFSVTNGLFLRPLSVPHPELMVRVVSQKPDSDVDIVSYPNYSRLRDRADCFSDLSAHQHTPISFSTGTNSDTVNAEVVSGNYFRAYGLSAISGRMISPEDDQKEGAQPVAVISFRLWEKYFQSNSDAIGRKIYLNGYAFQIIGVAPKTFRGSYLTSDSDLWAPIAMHEQVRPRGVPLDSPGWGWLSMTGRLKEGVAPATARAELAQIASQLQKEFPRVNDGLNFQIVKASALPEELSRQLGKALSFLSVVAGLILLVVCANITGALLPRVLARRREMAIRKALGASQLRLICQWFIESFTLCLLGGIAGILVALWCKEGLKLLLPPEWQTFLPAVSIDTKVLGFTLFVSLLTGIICGLSPLFQFRKQQIHENLKGETGGVPRYRLFGTFVSAQTSISLLLLIIAALLLRSLAGSATFRLGFDDKNLLLASIDTRRHGYLDERGRDFFQQLSERLKRLPMVQSVSYATVTPLDSGRESQGYKIPGQSEVIAIDNNSVGPDYFRTLAIPLISGRAFSDQDIRSNSLPVAIVNATMAKTFWPSESAVGKKIRMEGGPELEIIGIVRDIQYYAVGEEPRPYIYLTPNTIYIGQMTLQIRTAGRPEDLIPTLVHEIASVDPNVAPFQVMSFYSLRRFQLFPIRALATISTLIGLLGLILTALGIYGVVAYSIAQRTREIGVRMALGSPRGKVILMVLNHGMRFVFLGVALGIVAAFALTRFLSAVLFQVAPTDFISFFGTSALLFIIALVAASIPARKAMNIEPTVALRYE